METLNLPAVTLEGYARGGIQTSIGVPQIGAMFDAGTPIPTCLRYGNIFITHGHSDHSAAITSIIARRNLQDLPAANVHVPISIKEPLETIFEAWWKVNGGRGPRFPVNIIGHRPGDEIDLKKGIKIIGVKTFHSISSIGWSVERTTNRLKEEFQGMEGKEIGKLKREGKEVTYENAEVLLTIPGDTTIDFLVNEPRAKKARVLVHEVTYWDDEQSTPALCKKYGHTHFRDMIKHCEKFEGESLVLCHRSMKYSRKFVEDQVKKHFPKSMLSKISIFDGEFTRQG